LTSNEEFKIRNEKKTKKTATVGTPDVEQGGHHTILS